MLSYGKIYSCDFLYTVLRLLDEIQAQTLACMARKPKHKISIHTGKKWKMFWFAIVDTFLPDEVQIKQCAAKNVTVLLGDQEKVWIQDKLWWKRNDFHAALWGRLIISGDVANRLWLWATSFCTNVSVAEPQGLLGYIFLVCTVLLW